jgi:hypothetical protein
VLRRVLQQELKGIFAGFFAEIREDGDISPDDGLQCCAQISDDAAGTDDDSANDSKISDDPVAGQLNP